MKRRNSYGKDSKSDTSKSRESSPQSARPSGVLSAQEIDINSLIGAYRELSGRGRVEMLDKEAPSGSGFNILELSQPSKAMAHELMAQHYSAYRPVLQVSKAQKHFRIFVAPDMSREDWASIAARSRHPNTNAIVSSPRSNAIDLDRSLPPTPISESMQVSPIMANFNEHLIARLDLDSRLSYRAAIVSSVFGEITHVHRSPSPLSNEDEDTILQRRPIYIPRGAEIAVPPWLSDIEFTKPLSFCKNNVSSRRNFF